MYGFILGLKWSPISHEILQRFSIFSLDYENCPFIIQLVDYIAHILYLSNTHIVHYSYSTLVHKTAPGKYIVIKVEYGLQLHFKIFLNKSEKKNKKNKKCHKHVTNAPKGIGLA